MRKSGVLLPITSLPSKYGIGCFSEEAYKFVDDLVEARQSYWQILPLGPTGYGDSPYQSFSTYAGNPYLIDLQSLILKGYLTKEDCYVKGEEQNSSIDYEQIYQTRFLILKKAYLNSNIRTDEKFQAFLVENREWLEQYALYMAVKNNNEDKNWLEWDESIKKRQTKALNEAKEQFKEEIEYYQFQQYLFYQQWDQLKKYANNKGIQIVGDIPIYVALDSSDTWANPELFQFDDNCQPISVAGCPPDAFSSTGQLWGNPLYEWDY